MSQDGRSFDTFCDKVRCLLDPLAASKGYNGSGPDGDNALYEFVQAMTGGHHHAAGEIVYKIRRFEARGNVEDVLKAAAWCFLIWKHTD